MNMCGYCHCRMIAVSVAQFTGNVPLSENAFNSGSRSACLPSDTPNREARNASFTAAPCLPFHCLQRPDVALRPYRLLADFQAFSSIHLAIRNDSCEAAGVAAASVVQHPLERQPGGHPTRRADATLARLGPRGVLSLLQ